MTNIKIKFNYCCEVTFLFFGLLLCTPVTTTLYTILPFTVSSILFQLSHFHLLSLCSYPFSFFFFSFGFSILSLRCLIEIMDRNGPKIKSTILHHLYEKQRQSPYYDNLCRPVSDLLPFIANGIRGVTTNPAVLTTQFFLHLKTLLFSIWFYFYLVSVCWL